MERFLFAVNFRDRRRSYLVDHIDALRRILRDVHKELPFTIDAMVVLPDHWHSVWTLPPGDAVYPRWTIKAQFTRHLARNGVKQS